MAKTAEQSRAAIPAARLAEELTNRRSTAIANVDNGDSQKAALNALEGLQLTSDCQTSERIAAHAVEVSSGGYHLVG